MNRLIRTSLLALGLFTSTLLVGGCNSTIESSDLCEDWTPELDSVAMSEEQFKNFRSRHRHNTWRQVNDDWAMIWLEDRNMKLNRYTLP